MTGNQVNPDDDRPGEAARRADRLAAAARTVAGQLRRLIDPDQVVELRALRMADGTAGGGYTAAGPFRGDELAAMALEALKLSGLCQGVYYTLHPLRPDRFVRQAPRVQKVGRGGTAEDRDVLARRWLLVDVDPTRTPPAGPKDIATDGEKAAAWETAIRVREYLTAEGWAAPVVCDSGNGYHLLYRLAEPIPVGVLPTPAEDVIRRVLLHLADRFNSPAATVDTAVFNPGRIVKFPGTLACKGVPTEERPHRRAKVLEVPE